MSEPDPQTCEVKIHSYWCALSFEAAAIVYPRDVHRCPSCHGRITVLGTYSEQGIHRTMVHRQAHRGCPLMPDLYSGTPSRHPQAVA